MNIAITGGSGFIGSHVADRLLEAGHAVTVLDVRPPARRGIGFRALELGDLAGLIRATRGCDAIFHLAAVSNVNDAFADPVGAVTVNITGTANICEAARVNSIGRTVFASTVWVYAAATGAGPLREDAPFQLPNAGHVYTSTKIAGELLIHNYFDLYGQPFTILRYGIPFGPRMREELVIPRFVRMAVEREPITVHGDGSQFRNYVYVDDLADAHVLALSEAGENEVFNLEGAEPVTLRRIIASIQRILGTTVAVDFGSARPGDYVAQEVSGEKAKRVLGWEPITPFEDGLRRYIDWHLEEIELAAERATES